MSPFKIIPEQESQDTPGWTEEAVAKARSPQGVVYAS
jgi:hypothetical protein